MDQRLRLHEILKVLSTNVYFQPPTATKLVYPCIVYKRDRALSLPADNQVYRFTWGYQVTVIDKDPYGVISEKVARLPMTRHSRYFTAHNLHHDIFVLYY